MINGIGGITIAQAKENIPYDEFCQWVKYRNTKGSLNPSLRMEEMIALAISMNNAIHCKEMQPPNKFMPYISPDTFIFKSSKEESAEAITNPPIEAVFGLLKAVAKKK